MSKPYLIPLESITDTSGNLTPIEGGALPFSIARAFILHDIPAGARRGGHAHHTLEEFVVAVSGSFEVMTVNESGMHRWHLNRADKGLYIPPRTWRHLDNFSSNATALVLASTPYDETDYVRDYREFCNSLPLNEEDYFTKRGKNFNLFFGGTEEDIGTSR